MTALLDSNVVIYAAQPRHNDLRDLVAEISPAVSVVSLVEVLGYHGLTDAERSHFEAFFGAADVLPITDAVVSHAIRLRQLRKMTLGDAFIAGTALSQDLELLTHNIADFSWVPGLRVRDPLSPA